MKINIWSIALFLIVNCGLFYGPNTFAEEVITISTGEYPPWTGEKLNHFGFINHVITEAFKREGYAVRFKFYPWKRNYDAAKKGKFDATSYWYKSKEREKFFYYSDPVSTEKMVFFHLKSNPIKNWKTLDDLKDYKIGATGGYTYTKAFWDAEKSKQLDIQVAATDKQNFKKLLKGRIDIFPATLITGYSILRTEFDSVTTDMVTFNTKALSKITGHLLFPKSKKKSKKLLQVFNRGLKKLRKEGVIDRFEDDLFAGKYSNYKQ